MLQWLEHDASPASVAVVWLPMLPTDDAAAACSSATLFHDSRVAQFWDPERLTGKAWSADFQASQGWAVLDSMQADDPYRPFVERWLEDPASMPIWDVAYFYEPDIRWRDGIPPPSAWTKQVAYWGGADAFDEPDTTSVPGVPLVLSEPLDGEPRAANQQPAHEPPDTDESQDTGDPQEKGSQRATAQFWSHTSLRKMIESDWAREFAAGMQFIQRRPLEQ